jgi:hypothetical protein
MKLSAFKVDAKKIENGQWVRKIPDFPGVSFKVRGFTSQIYRKAAALEMDQFSRVDRMSGLTLEQLKIVTNKAICEAGVIDWAGLTDDEGKPMAFDKAVLMEMISDPDYRRFSESVEYAMAFVDQHASAEADDAAKN